MGLVLGRLLCLYCLRGALIRIEVSPDSAAREELVTVTPSSWMRPTTGVPYPTTSPPCRLSRRPLWLFAPMPAPFCRPNGFRPLAQQSLSVHVQSFEQHPRQAVLDAGASGRPKSSQSLVPPCASQAVHQEQPIRQRRATTRCQQTWRRRPYAPSLGH